MDVDLLHTIRSCTLCKDQLPHEPKPVLNYHPKARILLIGQAPGLKVHQTGIPWNDQSGKRLRSWLGVSNEQFYNPKIFAIVPMGFCYPGTGPSGDLPPMKICAPTWHTTILQELQNIELVLLIGTYAQKYYLPHLKKFTISEIIDQQDPENDRYFALPHPSPRNIRWFKNNPFFEEKVIPTLQWRVQQCLNKI